jgi:hypothetical protein
MSGTLIITDNKTLAQRVWHYLFKCPSFWSIKPKFKCPICGKKYRCYWDGHDTHGKINVCGKCAEELGEE